MQPIINLYAGTQVQYASAGTDIIIFQGENNAHSVFYGRRLTYLATDRGIAKFAFNRSTRTENGNGKVVYPMFIPSNFVGPLRSVDRRLQYDCIPQVPLSNDREYFANETYKVIECSSGQCSIILSIPEEDFTFMLASEFERIITTDNPFPHLGEGDSLFTNGIGFASLCNSGDKFWTVAGEANVVDTFTGYGHAQGWYVKSLRTQDWSFNNNMDGYGIVDIRVNGTSDNSQSGDLVITEMNTTLDEAFIEVGQLIKFTLNSQEPNRLIIMPQKKFRVQGVLKDAYFHIDYVCGIGWENRMRILAPQEDQNQDDLASHAFTATYGTSITSSLSQNDLYRTIRSMSQAGLSQIQCPVDRPPPTQQKYAVGAIVTAEVEGRSHIPFRFKNTEWKVSVYQGYNTVANQHQYKLTPHFKKNINKGSDVVVYENELNPVEKILKRKYTLARTIGKYRQGQVLTKEELVNTFAKFQDAQDPFILNKIYICAESPSEKSEH